MAQLISNELSSYALTPEEELAGRLLTDNQKMVIQNQIYELSMTRLRLEYTPDHHQQYLQAEAENKGQIQALKFLLELSEAAEEKILEGMDP
jgi:hypothetical protein